MHGKKVTFKVSLNITIKVKGWKLHQKNMCVCVQFNTEEINLPTVGLKVISYLLQSHGVAKDLDTTETT